MADHTVINRLSVSIASYRNQLSRCENLDDIEKICKNISDLEAEIASERRKDIANLVQHKDQLLQEMAALEEAIDEINRNINNHLSRYRDSLTSRITQIEGEVSQKKAELDSSLMDTPTIT